MERPGISGTQLPPTGLRAWKLSPRGALARRAWPSGEMGGSPTRGKPRFGGKKQVGRGRRGRKLEWVWEDE